LKKRGRIWTPGSTVAGAPCEDDQRTSPRRKIFFQKPPRALYKNNTTGSVDITDNQQGTIQTFGQNPNERGDLFDDLTVKQRHIRRLCNTFKEKKLQIIIGSKTKPKPLRFLVHMEVLEPGNTF